MTTKKQAEEVLKAFVDYYNKSQDNDGYMIGRAFVNDFLSTLPPP